MLLGACANNQNYVQESAVSMANPASVFCVEQGGKLDIRRDKEGNEYGVCIFADGREIEEWAFYRQHHQ